MLFTSVTLSPDIKCFAIIQSKISPFNKTPNRAKTCLSFLLSNTTFLIFAFSKYGFKAFITSFSFSLVTAKTNSVPPTDKCKLPALKKNANSPHPLKTLVISLAFSKLTRLTLLILTSFVASLVSNISSLL